MRILPWTLSVPEAGSPLMVPRLPFPYLLRSVLMEMAVGTGNPSFAHIELLDGASGPVFSAVSEGFTGLGRVCFAPGFVRNSVSVITDVSGAVPWGVNTYAPFLGAYITSCQGTLPLDCWVMPSMQLRLFSSAAVGAPSVMSAARILVGIP